MPCRTCLDWSDSSHARSRPGRCIWCSGPTWLVDDAGRPAHKVCSERVIEAAGDRQGTP